MCSQMPQGAGAARVSGKRGGSSYSGHLAGWRRTLQSKNSFPYRIAGIFRGVNLLWIRTILVIRENIFVLCIATLTTPHIMQVSLHMIEIFHENMAVNQFEVEAMVRGYHKYKDIWEATLGENLECQRENGNIHDIYAVAVLRSG